MTGGPRRWGRTAPAGDATDLWGVVSVTGGAGEGGEALKTACCAVWFVLIFFLAPRVCGARQRRCVRGHRAVGGGVPTVALVFSSCFLRTPRAGATPKKQSGPVLLVGLRRARPHRAGCIKLEARWDGWYMCG